MDKSLNQLISYDCLVQIFSR